MNTHEGYSKKTISNANVLLAGGGDKSLADFLSGIQYVSASNKIQYKTAADNASWLDLVTLVTTDENVKQTPKTDNANRPLMMINGGTSAGEQTSTSMFSTSIYANASTKMITANGFIKNGSDDTSVLLAGGGAKSVSDFAMANAYLPLAGGTMTLGEGLQFHADDNYFGTNADARIISLLDNNDSICDGGLIIDERGTLNGTTTVTELLRIRDNEFKWKGNIIYHAGNLPAYPTKNSWNYDDRYVTSLGTNGNYLTWDKNGTTNNITVPYATSAGSLVNQSGNITATEGGWHVLCSTTSSEGARWRLRFIFNNSGGSYGVFFSTLDWYGEWGNGVPNNIEFKNLYTYWADGFGLVKDGNEIKILIHFNGTPKQNVYMMAINSSIIGSAYGYTINTGNLPLFNGTPDYTWMSQTSSSYYYHIWPGIYSPTIRGNFIGDLTGNASTATNVAWSGITSPPDTATRWPTWDEVTNKPLSGDSGNNGPVWGNYVPVKSDGVMEIGKYLDFHNSSNDGVDYAVRLMCLGNNKVVINLPTSAGTLALTSQIPTVNNSTVGYSAYYSSASAISGNSLLTFGNNALTINAQTIDFPSMGEGFSITQDNNYFGTNNDAIIFTYRDTNVGSGGNAAGDGGIIVRFLGYEGTTLKGTREVLRIKCDYDDAAGHSGEFLWKGHDIYHTGNLPAYPTKASWNYDDRYVTFVGVTDDATNHPNLLRYVKNGTSNYFTVPYATNANGANYVNSLVNRTISTYNKGDGWYIIGSMNDNNGFRQTVTFNINRAGSEANAGYIKVFMSFDWSRGNAKALVQCYHILYVMTALGIYNDRSKSYICGYFKGGIGSTLDVPNSSVEQVNGNSSVTWADGVMSAPGGTPTKICDVIEGISTNQAFLATSFTGSLIGNASTASKLYTARNINGTSFDGSADITTSKWGTTRTLTIGNTSKSVNGSSDVSWSLAELGINTSTTGYAAYYSATNTISGIDLVQFSTNTITINALNINFPSMGEGFTITQDNNYFGTYNDAIIFTCKDTNGTSGSDGGFVFQTLAWNNNVHLETKELLVMRYTGGSNYGTFSWMGKTIYHSGNLPAYPTKSSWNYDDRYVSNVSINGNYLRITKNGGNTDLTIPYATTSGSTSTVNLVKGDSISTSGAGWFRVASYNSSNDMVRGLAAFSIITTGGSWSPFVQTVELDGTWSHAEVCNCRIIGLGYITKVRTTYDSSKVYIEIYTSSSVSGSIRVLNNSVGYHNVNSSWTWNTGALPSGGGTEVFKFEPSTLGFVTTGGITASGNIYATNFYTTSDRNKKTNISSFSEHIRKFQLKDTEKYAYGVIAQEVEEMFRDGEEGNMTVNYNSILSFYIGQLENKVKILEERIKRLESK